MQFNHHRLVAAAATMGLASAVLLFAAPAQAISVTLNGNNVPLNPPPIERAGRVLIPLRGVFEQLGATVVYSNGQINATRGRRTVSLNIGSTQATVDGQPQTIDVAPFIIGASTYVPLRFVSQALGAQVNWDGNNQLVSVTSYGVGGPGGEERTSVHDGHVDVEHHHVHASAAQLFETLRAVLGQRRFDAMCKAYLIANPSRSFTLRNLGARLESWLRKNPKWAGPNQNLALDIVRLEWADIEAFDGTAEPNLRPEDLASAAGPRGPETRRGGCRDSPSPQRGPRRRAAAEPARTGRSANGRRRRSTGPGAGRRACAPSP